jgi:hypothetical protein
VAYFDEREWLFYVQTAREREADDPAAFCKGDAEAHHAVVVTRD